MPSPATAADLLGLVRKVGLIDEEELAAVAFGLPSEPVACAGALVEAELLTPFQAKQLLSGRAGGLVLGPYRILRPLGKGGMGVVYLAEHTGLNRQAAVKVLSEEQSREELALERFFREARAAAALDHPNIVRLHDVAQSNGTHYLVMEYVNGVDLQALIEQTGSLHAAQAAGYVVQAATGLQHAHSRGIIHRDIKPANLIIGKNGVVKVLDMGLARSVSNPKDVITGRIDEDAITGTADFLSPEQALNVRLDVRTDIYSLGCTFYTLLTGRPPYEGSMGEKLVRHQMAPPPDVRAARLDVPPEMAAVIARMMAKKPEERYQTVSEVIAALAEWVPNAELSSRETIGVEPSPTAEMPKVVAPAPPAKGTHSPANLTRLVIACVASGCAVCILVAAGVYAAFGRSREYAAQDPAPLVSTPPAPAAPVAPAYRLVYAFKLSQGTAFRSWCENRQHSDPAPLELARSGLFMHCWKNESVAEFCGEPGDGRPWVGVTNINEELSSQILFQFDEGLLVPLVPGKQYHLRLEYRTAGEAEGKLEVRNPRHGEFPSIAEARLDHTGGNWKPVEVTFRRPTDGKLDVCVTNGAVGEGRLLAVRGVEVFEVVEDVGK